MKVSYKWLNEFLNNKAPKPEKMADLLTMHSMEIEGVEKAGDDFVMDVKTTPNMNHSCLCHRGIAREVAVLTNIKANKYSREFRDVKIVQTSKKLSVEIKDSKLCKRYIGRIIENVDSHESPKWLKEKLETLGQRSINNIVDATNFLMLELGQPMHVFDADKFDAKDILISVQNAKTKDRIMTLDGKDIELDESVLLITDGKNPLAIAGIKGGTHAELNEKTKNIILESASFDSVLIRKTSQRLKIQTDASKRYENDFSPKIVEEAMDILTKLIVEIAGTEDTKVGEIVDNYPRMSGKYKLGISEEEAQNIIGVKISEKEISSIFDKFGFEYKRVKPIDEVLKLAPTFVGIPYKLGASVSYDAPRFFDCSGFISYLFAEAGVQIPRISVDQFVFGKSAKETELIPGDVIYSNTGIGKIHNETIEFLKGTKVIGGVDHCGLYLGNGKVIHASSLNKKIVVEDLGKAKGFNNIVGYKRMIENENRFVVQVPDERLDLRIKEDLAEEIGRVYGYDKVREVIFSKSKENFKLDKVFFYKNEIRKELLALGFSEVINYSFVDNGETEILNPVSLDKKFLRTNLVDGMKKSLDFNLKYSELIEMPQVKVFEFGHIFNSKGEDERLVIGVKGPSGVKLSIEKNSLDLAVKALSDRLGLKLKKINKEENISEFDLTSSISDLSDPKDYDFPEILTKNIKFKKISQYPFMVRDIAVFTPDEISGDKVLEIILKESGDLVLKTRLFDVFKKRFPDGTQKTSYAYRLIFQSYERTLTDDEVNKIMERVSQKLNSTSGWQVR